MAGGDIHCGARPIFDDERLAEPVRQPLRDQPRQNVGGAGRRKADQQANRPASDNRPRAPALETPQRPRRRRVAINVGGWPSHDYSHSNVQGAAFGAKPGGLSSHFMPWPAPLRSASSIRQLPGTANALAWRMASHHGHEHHHGHTIMAIIMDHGHGHTHAPSTFGTAFAIATALNVALVAIQAIYGLLAHSMALLADAGHNAGDVLALLLAWGSHAISQRNPTERYTYGFRSSSIMAALINATILLVVTGAIAWAAIERFFDPQPVAGVTVMVVAALAIVINGAAAADPRAWQYRRPQCLRRVPASCRGRGGLRRRGGRRLAHPPDRLAMGRPGREPGHFRASSSGAHGACCATR